MRPVNLIPPDERRGEQAPLRTGVLVYLVVGAFVAVLVGVVAVVLMGNKIADRKADVEGLQREDAAASVKAQELASYVQFRELSKQRVETVTSLADSRFDWERVMRELSLVLPGDVWLVNLTATAAPGISIEGAETGSSSGGGLRSAAKGPALELQGCAAGQPAVAGFITDLKDIDGVTRVGVESSELPDEREGGAGVSAGGEAGSGGGSEDCRTRDFITEFHMVVAFDAAPVPTSSGEAEVAPTTSESAESSSESQEEAPAEG